MAKVSRCHFGVADNGSVNDPPLLLATQISSVIESRSGKFLAATTSSEIISPVKRSCTSHETEAARHINRPNCENANQPPFPHAYLRGGYIRKPFANRDRFNAYRGAHLTEQMSGDLSG